MRLEITKQPHLSGDRAIETLQARPVSVLRKQKKYGEKKKGNSVRQNTGVDWVRLAN